MVKILGSALDCVCLNSVSFSYKRLWTSYLHFGASICRYTLQNISANERSHIWLWFHKIVLELKKSYHLKHYTFPMVRYTNVCHFIVTTYSIYYSNINIGLLLIRHYHIAWVHRQLHHIGLCKYILWGSYHNVIS
jgi:hypothetical protein